MIKTKGRYCNGKGRLRQDKKDGGPPAGRLESGGWKHGKKALFFGGILVLIVSIV
jgi:hypothetical protein